MGLPKSVATLKGSEIIKITDSMLTDFTENVLLGQGKAVLSLGGVSQPIDAVMRSPHINHAANAASICLRMFRFMS